MAWRRSFVHVVSLSDFPVKLDQCAAPIWFEEHGRSLVINQTRMPRTLVQRLMARARGYCWCPRPRFEPAPPAARPPANHRRWWSPSPACAANRGLVRRPDIRVRRPVHGDGALCPHHRLVRMTLARSGRGSPPSPRPRRHRSCYVDLWLMLRVDYLGHVGSA